MIKTARAASAALLLVLIGATTAAWGAEDAPHIDRQKWTFGGFLGTFDNAQLQRGYKVYTEVCSRCHGLQRLSYRNLSEPGGPEFPEAAIKSLAATVQVDGDLDEQGKVTKRPATLADRLPSPYGNAAEGRFANNGALPPDLSLITKARSAEGSSPFYMVPVTMVRDIARSYQEGGTDYVYAYITGYTDPPPNFKMGEFMNYNRAFPGHQTAMPNPFVAGDGVVQYDDDTPPTVDNYARDVTAFLAWAADPKLEERKRMGLLVIGYLVLTAILLGLAKRRIWREVH
jgi:ubiquinol-cytochrome c reductase cytochrome c1 subunit